FALLAQLHDSGRGETLGVRCDPKPVPRRELFAGRQTGLAEGELGDDLAAICYGDDAAGLLRALHLEFDPAAEISDRVRYPRLHAPSPELSLFSSTSPGNAGSR